MMINIWYENQPTLSSDHIQPDTVPFAVDHSKLFKAYAFYIITYEPCGRYRTQLVNKRYGTTLHLELCLIKS